MIMIKFDSLDQKKKSGMNRALRMGMWRLQIKTGTEYRRSSDFRTTLCIFTFMACIRTLQLSAQNAHITKFYTVQGHQPSVGPAARYCGCLTTNTALRARINFAGTSATATETTPPHSEGSVEASPRDLVHRHSKCPITVFVTSSLRTAIASVVLEHIQTSTDQAQNGTRYLCSPEDQIGVRRQLYCHSSHHRLVQDQRRVYQD